MNNEAYHQTLEDALLASFDVVVAALEASDALDRDSAPLTLENAGHHFAKRMQAAEEVWWSAYEELAQQKHRLKASPGDCAAADVAMKASKAWGDVMEPFDATNFESVTENYIERWNAAENVWKDAYVVMYFRLRAVQTEAA
ncbi:MAG: hypothetical protein AAF871_13125 [Pseudomonadota bacterium]